MRRILVAVIEYLLGFLALAFFAYLAFGGGPTTDERLVSAFKSASPLALVEVIVLLWRSTPANRLILGANLWLIIGGIAAYLEQWWFLLDYQRLGEAGLFASMALVGIATTAFSPAGFIAAAGPRRRVVLASCVLLVAVGLAILGAVHFRGNVKFAAVMPVIGLSWLNRLLRHTVPRVA